MLGRAEELVSNASNLDCSMHPSSQGKLRYFSEHWKSAFQVKGRRVFFRSKQRQHRKVELNHNVKMCRDKVAFSAASSHGSYNICFNTVICFVGGNIFSLQNVSFSGGFFFGFIQCSTVHGKGDFVSQIPLNTVL